MKPGQQCVAPEHGDERSHFFSHIDGAKWEQGRMHGLRCSYVETGSAPPPAVTCAACGGSGSDTGRYPISGCKRCNGSGIHPAAQPKCGHEAGWCDACPGGGTGRHP